METRIPALGRRGEGWVALQVVLFVAIAAACWWSAATGGAASGLVRYAGGGATLAGVALIVWAVAALGPAVTVFPAPRDGGQLVETGPFRWIRHPIYAGVLLAALGACAATASPAALLLTLVLALVLDLKSRREEGWLTERYPAYAAYRARTNKFVPRIY